MWKYRKVFPIVCWLTWILFGLQTVAFYEEIPNVSMSADGNAFTTHAGETDTQWYENGTEIYTGVSGELREPESWEHFYGKVCIGRVPVEKWVVKWSEAKCIHKQYPSGNMIYGESFGRQYCKRPYFSGWLAYCADCKEQITHNYIYMSSETAQNFTYMDMDKAYYYICAHCNNLEMAVQQENHICKDISVNRYFVRYHANLGMGYMEKSIHMVNNATCYEGQEVTPQTTLNLNTYTRKGYEFVGWNTKQDGSGEYFADGAEIWNLTMEQNANVILYAQWRKSKSVLEIDPAGGAYANETDITRIEGEYASEYRVDVERISAPNGYTVHFDTQGGNTVADRTATKEFEEWRCSQPFCGSWEDNTYCFNGADGSVDRITAVYEDMSILLPDAKKEGYSFGGWYADKEATLPIGNVGDKYIPKEEITLYANWVELLLESEDNYTSNQGKGAVDLTWNQKDATDKVYMVYQKTDTSDWMQIEETQGNIQSLEVSKTISFSGEEAEYTVPYTGFYTLTLTGAQGSDYEEHSGGKGGMVQAVIYLERGEKLTYVIGGQNGFPNGGIGNVYGCGGGYSWVSSEKQGVLLVAGGGGGASAYDNGEEGGSAKHVVSEEGGQDGDAGGGGGYQGGVASIVESHQHTDNCAHVHIGVAGSYGGCYTKLVECGSTDISKKEQWRSFYYGNIDEDGNHRYCVRCASDTCTGHYDIMYQYTCKVCEASSNDAFTKCTAVTAYAPACGLSEEYTCGMEEGQVIKNVAAHGGSSFLKEEVCIEYTQEAGVREGDGEFTIVSKIIGVMEENALPGVIATDMAPPDAIDLKSITLTAVAEDAIRVAFAKPKDNGTTYYHMVESYEKKTNEHLCTSNQTKNILTSGVVGYRYVVDERAETIVTQQNAYLDEKGEEPFLTEKVSGSIRYLHIAAVDRAGNIGPTAHLVLSSDEVIYWPLVTEKLRIEAGSQVYPADATDSYFVKADGSTPVTITLEGLLCGTARAAYQINLAGFQVKNSNTYQTGQLSLKIPNRSMITAGMYTYPMSELQKKTEGHLGMQDAGYTMAKRFNMCKSLMAIQKFVIPNTMDGEMVQVIPRVAAMNEKEAVWSQEENDLTNSIYLIADGKGPDITGLDVLADLNNLELPEGECLEIDVCAADAGSGLAAYYVEIHNLENGMIVRYTDEVLSGKISFTISKEEEIFQGEFAIVAYAVDNVGNETSKQDNLLNIGLVAYVKRVLSPHTPVFKKGESGVLHIETIGYVEKVEVFFPQAFVKHDASLNRTFVYEVPEYLQTEEISFMVPLEVTEGEVTILVKAYKAGTELEKEPELLTLTIGGSILDELRTRLR